MSADERLNVCTHVAGLLLVLVGGAWVLDRLLPVEDWAALIGATVFLLSGLALYAASVLFHATQGAARLRWQRLDHAAIHALIAGSLTPFVLIGWPGVPGWALLAVVWAAAAACIRRELRGDAPDRASLRLYMVLGWVSVATAAFAMASDPRSLYWLLAGAALYTVGAGLFYLDPWRLPQAHAMWHLSVVGGTASHLVALSGAVA